MKSILHLLALEWKKFKGNAVCQLLSIMFLVLMPTLLFFGKELSDVPPPLPSNDVFFNFPTIWEYNGYVGNWLVFFFLGFIAIYIITSEVNNKTLRQSIIIGMTRKQFFLGKLSVIVVLTLFATVLYTICTLVIGGFHADSFSFSAAFDNDQAILRFFLMTLGYLSFGLMLGFVIRRSGIAIFTYLSYIMFIELIIRWAIHFNTFKDNTMNFYPMNAIEDLMPNPFFKYAELIPRKDLDFSFLLTYNEAIITTSIYIVIFIGLSYWNFMKKDI